MHVKICSILLTAHTHAYTITARMPLTVHSLLQKCLHAAHSCAVLARPSNSSGSWHCTNAHQTADIEPLQKHKFQTDKSHHHDTDMLLYSNDITPESPRLSVAPSVTLHWRSNYTCTHSTDYCTQHIPTGTNTLTHPTQSSCLHSHHGPPVRPLSPTTPHAPHASKLQSQPYTPAMCPSTSHRPQRGRHHPTR